MDPAATQIKNGSCKRGKGKSIHINKNTLSRMLSRLTAAEVNEILDGTVQTLAKKGFICGSKFILDATDIETTPRCEGRGVKKVKKRRYLKQKKQWIEREELVYGYKLIVIWEKVSRVIVAAKVVKIASEMLREGVYVIGFGYPVVPHGKARIRLQVSDALTYEDIDYALNILSITYNNFLK